MRPRRSPIAVTLFGVISLLCAPASAAPAAPAAPAPKAARSPDEVAQPWRLGALRLETNAVGAEVWIDERLVGRAPLPGAWTLSGGSHAVRLELDGWRASAEALVSVGSVTTLTLNRDGQERVGDAPAAGAPREPAREELPPQLERVHPGAGIPVRGVGYTLLAVGVGALGYGVYAHLTSDQERLRALQIGDARADERERALGGAMTGLWSARLAIGSGLLSALSGVAMLGWSREGWFVEERAPELGD